MIVYLGGGLGNQMFEYAYARAIQEKEGVALSFDCSELQYHGYEGRSYGLDKLNIYKSNTRKKDQRLRYYLFKIKKKIYTHIKGNLDTEELSKFFDRKGMIISTSTYEYRKHLTNKRAKYMYGNFQSWKYFKEIDDMICKELQIIAPQSEENRKVEKEILNCDSVCVHIRRGDYVNDTSWNQLNICDYSYYKKGMEIVAQSTRSPVFYIFSNDSTEIRWIKENYDFSQYTIKYVDMNNPDYEELRLMSACKHFIISNSTFSWWAQHLSKNKEKTVIAPDVWNLEENASDLYEDNWIRIETRKY